jgi:CBS domain-containing protein
LLSLSVKDYLTQHSKASLTPIASKRSDTLATVVTLMLEKRIHRVWVVDAADKPIGVVAMTDVFKVVRDHVEESIGGANEHDARASYGSTIKTFHGQAIANDGGHVTLRSSDAASQHSLWTVQHIDNDKIQLINNGKYLAVDSKHAVTLLDAASSDTAFELLHSDTGAVALRDAHNGFLEVHGNNVTSHASNKTARPTRKQWFKMTGAFAAKQ